MGKTDDQFARIDSIIGSDEDADFGEAVAKFVKHLKAHLKLPCEVNGIEDFNWEEPYVIGGWSKQEYEKLKKTQPSYRDHFELLSIEEDADSKWMMCSGDDVGANVKRVKDGKKFVLGLSELEVIDKKSPNFQLIEDFAVFFANYR